MKLWQKIFFPSMVLTMIGIFAIAISFVVRSHTLQLEKKTDEMLIRANDVTRELQQSVDTLFFSVSQMQSLTETLEQKYSDEDYVVAIYTIDKNLNSKRASKDSSLNEYSYGEMMVMYMTTTTYIMPEFEAELNG